MENRREDQTVEFVPPGGWLWQFSNSFHQDYGLLGKDFRAGAAMFIEGLTPAQRKVLRVELSTFLAKHEDLPPNSLKRVWMKLGAQWCQRDIDMREALNEVVGTL
jgi:hypothetical protein